MLLKRRLLWINKHFHHFPYMFVIWKMKSLVEEMISCDTHVSCIQCLCSFVGQYFSTSLILIALSIICTVCVINVFDKGERGVTEFSPKNQVKWKYLVKVTRTHNKCLVQITREFCAILLYFCLSCEKYKLYLSLIYWVICQSKRNFTGGKSSTFFSVDDN